MKLKKGDTVKVVAGKDKGKQGLVERVVIKENKVLVAGVNEFKRHIKARSKGEKSEIKTITKPLPAASVMFLCPKCHQNARLGFLMRTDKKVRICKKCEEIV